jgi:hypothetical protein
MAAFPDGAAGEGEQSMSPLIRLFGGIAALIALLVAVGFALPATVTVARATTINAPEAQIFPLLNSFRRFNEWSPWAETDPEAQYSFSGPESGVGARMDWTGEAIGKGSQEILKSDPNREVDVALKFEGRSDATSRFLLAPSGAGTRVTWQFQTELGANPIDRWMGVMLERFIGADYERGLERLRILAESRPAPSPIAPAE